MPVKIDADKIARAQAATPTAEAQKVFLPQSAPWLADFPYEHSVFPAGAHDDMVDTTSQALNYLRGHNHTYGLLARFVRMKQRYSVPAAACAAGSAAGRSFGRSSDRR